MQGDITKSYVPIVTVVAILATFGTIIWFTATKTSEINQVVKNQDEMAAQMRDVPTRNEYNLLEKSISEVKTAIENLGKEIRAKK